MYHTGENTETDWQTPCWPFCWRIHISGVDLACRRDLAEPSLAAGEGGVAPTKNRVVVQKGRGHNIGTRIERLSSAESREGCTRISKE